MQPVSGEIDPGVEWADWWGRVNRTAFSEFFENYPSILGEGVVIERLRRNSDLELDPHIVNSAFVYDPEKRAALEGICWQYLDIGFQYGLPLLPGGPVGNGLLQPVMPSWT